MKARFPKQHRAFQWKHLLKKPTMEEKRLFYAQLLQEELNSGKPDFFGIKLWRNTKEYFDKKQSVKAVFLRLKTKDNGRVRDEIEKRKKLTARKYE